MLEFAMTENEEWRAVVGYEGEYEVSSLGRVRSLDRLIHARAGGQKPAYKYAVKGGLLKPAIHPKKKYESVTFPSRQGGRWHQRPVLVHHLVAAAFIGVKPDGHEVCHWDGNKGNNRSDNLRYATHAENEADKERHGTRLRGESHHWTKLTKEQVREIRLLAPYDSNQLLADHYGVHPTMISMIYKNRCWHDKAYVPQERRVLH